MDLIPKQKVFINAAKEKKKSKHKKSMSDPGMAMFLSVEKKYISHKHLHYMLSSPDQILQIVTYVPRFLHQRFKCAPMHMKAKILLFKACDISSCYWRHTTL